MPDDERIRLEKAHMEADRLFAEAREALHKRIGTSPKEEFLALSDAVDRAWEEVLETRAALDAYIRALSLEPSSSSQTA